MLLLQPPPCGFDGDTGMEAEQWRCLQAALQEYDTIRCVNYIRKEVAAGRDPRSALTAAAAASSELRPWADDRYLQPVLEDDALLFFDYEDNAEAMCAPDRRPPAVTFSHVCIAPRLQSKLMDAVNFPDRDTASGAAAGPSSAGVPGSAGQTDVVDGLRAENARLRDMIQRLAAADVSPELVAAAQVCTASVHCRKLCWLLAASMMLQPTRCSQGSGRAERLGRRYIGRRHRTPWCWRPTDGC